MGWASRRHPPAWEHACRLQGALTPACWRSPQNQHPYNEERPRESDANGGTDGNCGGREALLTGTLATVPSGLLPGDTGLHSASPSSAASRPSAGQGPGVPEPALPGKAQHLPSLPKALWGAPPGRWRSRAGPSPGPGRQAACDTLRPHPREGLRHPGHTSSQFHGAKTRPLCPQHTRQEPSGHLLPVAQPWPARRFSPDSR